MGSMLQPEGRLTEGSRPIREKALQYSEQDNSRCVTTARNAIKQLHFQKAGRKSDSQKESSTLLAGTAEA